MDDPEGKAGMTPADAVPRRRAAWRPDQVAGPRKRREHPAMEGWSGRQDLNPVPCS